jgi:hypothetical protein
MSGCGLNFTDAAIEWGDTWREGYVDRTLEEGSGIRDGPFKLKCELCGRRSMYHIFGRSVTLIAEQSGDGTAS